LMAIKKKCEVNDKGAYKKKSLNFMYIYIETMQIFRDS